MSVQKFVARAFALFAVLMGGVFLLSATVADAHPHKRYKKRHYHSSSNTSSAREVELQVTIHRLIALDKGDAFSSEDFFARVTIDGQVFKSERIRQTDAVIPNWRFAAIVPSGRIDVRIEVFDKDLAADDPIDINRVDPKRSLDFVVNTRSCRLEGFSSPYRCRQDVVRAGGERKKAEMTFSVDVVRAD
jgi:hypothetical protein